MSLINMLVEASCGANNFSARFDGAASPHQMLERTPGVHTSRRIFTLSFFFKANSGFGLFSPTPIYSGYDLTGSNITEFAHVAHSYDTQFPNGPGRLLYFDEGGTNMQNIENNGSGTTSDWEHFLLAVDTTQATLSNRIRTYCNGTEMTSGTVTCPQNTDAILTLNELHMIGAAFNGVAVDYVSDIDWAYTHIAEMHYIDGQQLTPSSFMVAGTPVKAKAYTGTYGAQGFYLNFADANNMGKDVSGNGNHWTPHTGLNPPTQSNLNPFNF